MAAMAESGWDFSSRWLRDPRSLAQSRVDDVLPVDLNAAMYGVEANLARLHSLAGSADSVVQGYTDAAAARRRAMDAVMWNEARHRAAVCWRGGSALFTCDTVWCRRQDSGLITGFRHPSRAGR
jgi:alpha,alpha-trehalase